MPKPNRIKIHKVKATKKLAFHYAVDLDGGTIRGQLSYDKLKPETLNAIEGIFTTHVPEIDAEVTDLNAVTTLNGIIQALSRIKEAIEFKLL